MKPTAKEIWGYRLRKLHCLLLGHDWYIVDYIRGMEDGIWNIKECGRCRKTEFD